MSAIHVASDVTIDHAALGGEAWGWSDGEQAAFLTGFARAFGSQGGIGLLQIHYIAEALRKSPMDLNAVRWLNDHLTEYLKEEK